MALANSAAAPNLSPLDRASRDANAFEDAVHLNRAILESAGEGIYGLDLNGVTTFANPAAARMTGWSAEELLGKPQHAQIHHSKSDGSLYPRETCPIYAALHDGEVHHRDDEVFWRKNGTCFPIAYTSTPLRKEGVLVGAVVVFRDITEQKKREQWDRNYREVLELVARNAPLTQSFEVLIEAVSAQQPGLCASIVLHHRNGNLVIGRNHNEFLALGLHLCWSRPIVSGSGIVLGNFSASRLDGAEMRPAFCEILEMACGLLRIAIEHRNLLDQMAHQSTHDVLTGLANRVLFEDRLEQALANAKRVQGRVAIYLIDLDRFKEVNDGWGHAVGDELLRQTASRMKSVLNAGDTLARMGGDEFAIIVPGIAEVTEASAIAERMKEALEDPVVINGHEFFASLSIGASLYPDHGLDSLTLQKNSDEAMYRVKGQGGDNFEIFDPAASALAAQAVRIELYLREALIKNWFRLEYQPQFELSGTLIGMEALLRLHPPGEKVIEPFRFLPIAEQTGLIVPIGAWVLREACRQGAEWRRQGFAPINIAVNVSARQISVPGFAASVLSILAETEFTPAQLELELTESCLITSNVHSSRQLKQLRDAGIEISIDDFGTGYSSLSRLHELPVSTIKIDKLFIDRVAANNGGFEIVEAIVSLGKQLGFRVIVEGVETGTQFEILKQLGHVIVQGFLLGRPECAKSVERHLEAVPAKAQLVRLISAISEKPGLKPCRSL